MVHLAQFNLITLMLMFTLSYRYSEQVHEIFVNLLLTTLITCVQHFWTSNVRHVAHNLFIKRASVFFVRASYNIAKLFMLTVTMTAYGQQ